MYKATAKCTSITTKAMMIKTTEKAGEKEEEIYNNATTIIRNSRVQKVYLTYKTNTYF